MNFKSTSRNRFAPALFGGLVALGGLGLAPAAPAHAETTCVPLSWPGGATQLCAPNTGSTSGGLKEGYSDIWGGNIVIQAPTTGATGAPAVAPGWKTTGSSTGSGTSTVTCQLGSTATGGWSVTCPTPVAPGATVVSVVAI